VNVVKTTIAIALTASLALGCQSVALAYSPSHSVESKAGQFCKKADIGKKKTADNGARIKCTKSGDRARWKND